MNRAEAEAFARAWIAAWNRRDIDAIVAHYAPDGRFTSPIARERTGHATVVGPEALRAYWDGAHRLPHLHFTLDRALWDADGRELVVIYVSDRGAEKLRAMEVMRFGADGLVHEGEVMYGAALP